MHVSGWVPPTHAIWLLPRVALVMAPLQPRIRRGVENMGLGKRGGGVKGVCVGSFDVFIKLCTEETPFPGVNSL